MLVAGGLVYDHDGDTDRPAAADILIEGNRIAAVGQGCAPCTRARLSAKRGTT